MIMGAVYFLYYGILLKKALFLPQTIVSTKLMSSVNRPDYYWIFEAESQYLEKT